MKPAPFEYFAPDTLDEALSLMNQYGDEAKALAGGQSLVPVMNFRLSQPTILIDLNNVPQLQATQFDDQERMVIGAMQRHAQLEQSSQLAAHAPLMHETMPFIAHPQIRNRGTIGGSIAHADPAGELPVICVALDGWFLLAQEGGERWVKADDFFKGLFETELQPNELITAVKLPKQPPNYGYAFHELARRHGDYAQAGVAVSLSVGENGRIQNPRLVFLNVGERPMVARQAMTQLEGQVLDDDLLETAVQTATTQEIDPTTDVHATAAYKQHLAGVLAKRALKQAVQRATNRSSQ